MPYPLVTLCGSYNFHHHWVLDCIKSWENIKNLNGEYYIVPDSNLEPHDELQFKNLGFKSFNSSEDKNKIDDFLLKFPSLTKMRNLDVTWRKLLDTTIHLRGAGKVVLIDTDVLVTAPCFLPEGDFEICYMREDIPAYRANWSIVWQELMVPAFNAGLVIFDPDTIDFDFLEYLTKKYFLNCKDYWWTEQAAWACIAGKMSKRLLFDGQQVRVLSGFRKRNLGEVLKNEYNYFGKRGILSNFEQFRPFVSGSLIIHFAGLGKSWFTDSLNTLKQNEKSESIFNIEAQQENTLSLKDKILIGTRLFLKELK